MQLLNPVVQSSFLNFWCQSLQAFCGALFLPQFAPIICVFCHAFVLFHRRGNKSHAVSRRNNGKYCLADCPHSHHPSSLLSPFSCGIENQKFNLIIRQPFLQIYMPNNNTVKDGNHFSCFATCQLIATLLTLLLIPQSVHPIVSCTSLFFHSNLDMYSVSLLFFCWWFSCIFFS